MYSYNDFERLFLRYKLEGIPAGISIEKFCMSNQVPYNLFSKWYKDTQKKIVPVQVLGSLHFFDVIYWRTAVWRLSLGYTSKLGDNIKKRLLLGISG